MPGLEDAAPVLLIEDDEDARDATAAVLEQDGFLVVALADYEAALGELGRGLVCAP